MEELRYEYPEEVGGRLFRSARSARASGVGRRQATLSRRDSGKGLRFAHARIGNCRAHALCAVFLDRRRHRPVRALAASTKTANQVKPILCQGRGSAANSTICYCLEVTSVDPAKNQLLFDRFVSEERDEPPDIDVDFEHERREEVIQYVYQKYGRDRAGLAATLICYRGRSAIREVAKTFGYSEDQISSLAKALHWWSSGVEEKDLQEQGLDVHDKKLMQCVALANQLQGFPRHLSQHVGGFVITREKLHDVVPVQNAAMEDRTVVEWNKDDLEDLGDSQGRSSGPGHADVPQKAFDLHEKHYSGEPLITLTSRTDDERVYKMLHRAEFHRRVSDREPGADVDAAAVCGPRISTISSLKWRSCGLGPFRAAWCIPI